MKEAMSSEAHKRLRERMDRERERARHNAEVQLAAEIQTAFPELTRDECLRRAREKVTKETS